MIPVAIALIVIIYASGLVMLKSVSAGGRLSLMFALLNALGWIVILMLQGEGHPPPWLFPFIAFWLLSLIVIPAAGVALWKSHKEGDEKKTYLKMAGFYFLVNFVVLFVFPIVWWLA